MTELNLKSSISVLEAFNDVRNNKSLAHDNPILNYAEESLLSSITSPPLFVSSRHRPREFRWEGHESGPLIFRLSWREVAATV